MESNFVNYDTQIVVKKKKDFFTRVFEYLESFIAFFIAVILLVTVSYGFPVYLIPLSFIVMIIFMVYVFAQVNTKGVMFVSVIYVLLLANMGFLIYLTIRRCFQKSMMTGSFFYA